MQSLRWRTTGKANFKELGMSFLPMIHADDRTNDGHDGSDHGNQSGWRRRGARINGPLAVERQAALFSGGQPYVVGERGPELFVPPKSGSIKSNKEKRQT